jgi:DNA repair protein RadC
MAKKIECTETFLNSLNSLTGISKRKIKNYSKEHNPFNILEHPMVIEPSENQLKKISMLNEFIASYGVLKLKEEQERIKFTCPSEVGNYFLSLLGGMKDKERFMVAFLDNGNHIIETRVISEGTINSALVSPREILKVALANDCTKLILSHNHPGASLSFSSEDRLMTQRIVDIFDPLNITVLDHIVIAGNQYVSMANEGCLPKIALNEAKYDPIPLKKLDVAEETLDFEQDSEDEELEL